MAAPGDWTSADGAFSSPETDTGIKEPKLPGPALAPQGQEGANRFASPAVPAGRWVTIFVPAGMSVWLGPSPFTRSDGRTRSWPGR